MKWRVKEVAERVGIKNASQLNKRTGLGLTTAYQLWNGTAELVAVRTLNTLCNVLQVGPAMLFDYTPDVDSGAGDESTHAESTTGKRSKPTRTKQTARRASSAGLSVQSNC